MKIVILGAGRVGESAAEALASENNDITLVDTDPGRLADVQGRLDLRTVAGNCIQPSVLRDAGAEDSDMLIACTPLDETNLVACKVAHDVFGVPTTIARLRSDEFAAGSALLDKKGFAVDAVICPEQSVTQYIRKLIEYPSALQVLEFARGLVSLVVVRVVNDGPLARHVLADTPALVPAAQMRIVAIYRRNRALTRLDGATRIEPGDEVFVLAASAHLHDVLGALGKLGEPTRRIMIAGGGKVGLRVARQINAEYQLKLIEPSRARCEYLAGELPAEVLVLQGDATDAALLDHENVQDMDMFCALTSDDENNIMSCLLAKRLGARRVLAVINRRAYAELVQGTELDIAISPSQAVLGELLTHVRRGDVEAVHSLRHGAVEALEGVVRGDEKQSRLTGRRIEEIALPEGAQIGAIVRGLHLRDGSEADSAKARVIIPHHDTTIVQYDHVVVFVPRKRMVRDIEKLFQVKATFF